jgi:hypothetical protein
VIDKKVALITTTINVPTVLERYVIDWKRDSDEDLEIIVAGDVQTPAETQEYVEGVLDGTYIGIDTSNATRWRSHYVIGTRSIQRRNLALLHAISIGADVIITVDDDNLPSDHYVRRMLNRLGAKRQSLWTSPNGWFNPGGLLSPPTWARGFPIHERSTTPGAMLGVCGPGGHRLVLGSTHRPSVDPTDVDSVAVVNGLTTGDPDVDAFERLANQPWATHVMASQNMVLNTGTWAPINTQNTGFTREAAPLFQVMCGVGRYDDILASYVARAVLDSFHMHVSYGHPTTHSVRNEHDLIKDLENELFGYRVTPLFCERLRSVTMTGSVINRLADAYEFVRDLLPAHTKDANDVWLDDVETALKEGDH